MFFIQYNTYVGPIDAEVSFIRLSRILDRMFVHTEAICVYL